MQFARTAEKNTALRFMFSKSQAGVLRLSTYFNITLYLALYCDRGMFAVDPATTSKDEPAVVSDIISRELQQLNLLMLQKKLPYGVVTTPQFNVLATRIIQFMVTTPSLEDKYGQQHIIAELCQLYNPLGDNILDNYMSIQARSLVF